MRRYFYTELVDIESLVVELDSLKLLPREKKHLAELVDSQIHAAVLDTVLSELNETERKIFIEHLKEGKDVETWEHLKTQVDNIEGKITKTVDDLKKELHKDIREAKEKK